MKGHLFWVFILEGLLGLHRTAQFQLDCDGYSISSKCFLPTVVDIMVIWVKFTHSSHFSLLILKLSMFTLAITCFTTSNLPWFMDLTFQVPMQYYSLQHWILLPSPVTSTTGLFFFFALAPSLHSFWSYFCTAPIGAYWAPTHLGSSSFSILSFCLFILCMGFSRQEYWCGLPFPSPVDHVLSELSTVTCPSWVALHGMDHNFTELDKAVVHLIRLVILLWLWFSFCLPSDGEG